MAMSEALLPEFDHEMGTTRRLLERTPADRFAWKPHDKSMNLGQLAGHLANIPHWMDVILQHMVFDMATAAEDTRPRTPESVAWLLSDFDTKVRGARAGLAAAGDAEMLAAWTFKKGGHEIFTMPRGQLSVYLRMNDVPLPSMYGPTADEQ
jgi:uncharacterized damage-inducible protein DinB